MNKKLIAIAVASVMAAPVAMADVSVSGAFFGELVSRNDVSAAAAGINQTTGGTLAMEDGGINTLAFNASSGNVYGKLGLNVGPAASAAEGTFQPTYRDFYLGYKLADGASLQMGTMNGAIKNLEKDGWIATFLQTRNTFADARTSGAFGSSSYVSNVIQYKAKVGAGTLIAQYNPTGDTLTSGSEGHMGVSYAAKTAGVNWYVGYNNGNGSELTTTDDTNMKLGATMKFGAIKANLNYTTADTGTADWSALAVKATMKLGTGLDGNVAFGTTSGDVEGTYMRVAVRKSMSKNGSLYAGYTSNEAEGSDAETKMGLGFGLKF